jgi:GNAT superfamily N-acetyltransferase
MCATDQSQHAPPIGRGLDIRIDWSRIEVSTKRRRFGAVTDELIAVELLDGTTVHLRPILSTDADALVDFHEGLTNETTRLRFFALHPHLTNGEIETFTQVDHGDREALVALDGTQIIAVGRYDRTPGTDEAEVAFVVADSWQGDGIGTHLLEQLSHRARAAGITGLFAETLSENRRMRDVFNRSGRVVASETHSGEVHVVLDLRLELP